MWSSEIIMVSSPVSSIASQCTSFSCISLSSCNRLQGIMSMMGSTFMINILEVAIVGNQISRKSSLLVALEDRLLIRCQDILHMLSGFAHFLSWMIGGVFCKSLTVISKVLSSQIVVQNIGPCVNPSFITQMVVLQKDVASFGGLNGF